LILQIQALGIVAQLRLCDWTGDFARMKADQSEWNPSVGPSDSCYLPQRAILCRRASKLGLIGV
jgi:hypothetical protein